MEQQVRVRFAPSPTGHLHVGGARTALFNWLFSRKHSGSFILRIEDTDLGRSSVESEKIIMEDMKWLGLNWDEGPDKEGNYGPYRQTERLEIYRQYAQKLLDNGDAYWCYCTKEELEEQKEHAISEKENIGYSGKCLKISENEKNERINKSIKPAIRFHIKDKTDIVVNDIVKGDVFFNKETLSDFIIVKSNGTPSYNFAVVIDDALMKISHVIRGDEHLINTPKQIILYKALGLPIPKFAHLSMILAPDKTKLSKRHNTTSVNEYKLEGLLPDAIINYIALLGWSPANDREIFPKNELIEAFSIDRVSKSSAVYDITKLTWMNGQYIKDMDKNKLLELLIPYYEKIPNYSETISQKPENWLFELTTTICEYLKKLGDIKDVSMDFFTDYCDFEDDSKILIQTPENKKLFESLINNLNLLSEITGENFNDAVKQSGKETSIKGKDLFMAVRSAITGKTHGLELKKLAPLFGKEKLINRLKKAFDYSLQHQI